MYFLSLITRYLNEPFLEEFADYYLAEGVDHIYVLFDVDSTLPICDSVFRNPKVTVIPSHSFKERQTLDVNRLYQTIRDKTEWVLFVDCDEFISTRKTEANSIRDELKTTFRKADCVKVPWVMMSSNGRENDPPSILQHITHRWNHDVKHPHPGGWAKGRCRYEQIEVKCFTRCSKFAQLNLHHPVGNIETNTVCVDSVHNKLAIIDPFFNNLRESDIQSAHMVCYHYRIFSKQSVNRKCINNKLVNYQPKFVQHLLDSDHADIEDDYMKRKSLVRSRSKISKRP
jgi:hypothetical protein